MEAKASKSSQIIDIIADVQGGVPGIGSNKICPGTTCDFSDSAASSKDANERITSIRKLLFVVILCIIFMSVEVVGGMKANSLAILTDAAHLLTDVAAFAISLISIWASGWEATPRQSYGFFRLEILGALVSIQSIWLITGILVYQAIERLIYGSGEVQGVLMFAVAAFGLVVNIIMAIFLGHDHDGHGHGHGHSHGNHGHGHHPKDHGSDHAHVMEHGHSSVISITTHHHHSKDGKHTEKCEPLLNKSKDAPNENTDSRGTKLKQRNINVHSAYLHVLGDCIQSTGVMIGGAIIWYKPQWKVIDLVCTLIFSFIVLLTTIKMLRNILEVLMESTPREIDATRIEKGLCELDGVVAIHELHIWAITVGKVLLACHVTITPEADADLVLDKVIRYIKREYNISHVTIQIERQ
ncbi:metal tolerance protein 1-like [Typha angustifolia]|uniref:metal tolerance protein 1-like n=1 Tax=Typha angustifolia TaxID=59011 RepID=UPI003C2E5A50